MLAGFVIANHIRPSEYLFPFIYCSVLDPPEETQHDSFSNIYQDNYSILYDYAKHSKSALQAALKAQIFISGPIQDTNKLCLKSLAINTVSLMSILW